MLLTLKLLETVWRCYERMTTVCCEQVCDVWDYLFRGGSWRILSGWRQLLAMREGWKPCLLTVTTHCDYSSQ